MAFDSSQFCAALHLCSLDPTFPIPDNSEIIELAAMDGHRDLLAHYLFNPKTTVDGSLIALLMHRYPGFAKWVVLNGRKICVKNRVRGYDGRTIFHKSISPCNGRRSSYLSWKMVYQRIPCKHCFPSNQLKLKFK